MHAHLAEIIPETWFHERTRGGIKRLARRTQDLVNDGRHFVGCFRTRGATLHGWRTTGRLAFLLFFTLRLRHPHHCLRHPIRFSLVLIVRLADFELGLHVHRAGVARATEGARARGERTGNISLTASIAACRHGAEITAGADPRRLFGRRHDILGKGADCGVLPEFSFLEGCCESPWLEHCLGFHVPIPR
jgi:hypothetical protein